MTQYSKFNVIYLLQKWLDSVPGQTFMNYAYSWGASIVILGALFKLTHLPGANFMLFLGMGTEVLVFFIAGFDRPFDKTEEGKELPTHVTTDIEGAVVTSADGETIISDTSAEGATVVSGGGIIGGGGGVIGGGGGVIGGGGGAIGGGGGTIVIGGGGSMPEGAVAAMGTGEGGSEGQPGAVGGIGGGIIGGVISQQPELPDIDPEEMEEATQPSKQPKLLATASLPLAPPSLAR